MNVQQVQRRNYAPESDQHSTQLIGRLLIAAGALRPAGAPAASVIEIGSEMCAFAMTKRCSPGNPMFTCSQVQYAVQICVIVGAAIG
jgi:hypothetical protein